MYSCTRTQLHIEYVLYVYNITAVHVYACLLYSIITSDTVEHDRYSSSILYESTKVVRKYESIIRKYFRTKVTYLRRYFRTLLVRKYFRISGSTEEYTTYFHYVRTFITFVRKYESTTTRTRTCTTTCTRSYFYGFVHQHSLILYVLQLGLHVRARVHSYIRTDRAHQYHFLYVHTYSK